MAKETFGIKARRDKRDNKKEICLKALDKSLGIVTPACKEADISRQTFYRWIEEDPEFAEAVKEIGEKQGDFVENALLKNIKNGDTGSITFYCRTKLKERGYVSRQEITGDIQMVVVDKDDSDL